MLNTDSVWSSCHCLSHAFYLFHGLLLFFFPLRLLCSPACIFLWLCVSVLWAWQSSHSSGLPDCWLAYTSAIRVLISSVVYLPWFFIYSSPNHCFSQCSRLRPSTAQILCFDLCSVFCLLWLTLVCLCHRISTCPTASLPACRSYSHARSPTFVSTQPRFATHLHPLGFWWLGFCTFTKFPTALCLHLLKF